MSNIHQITEQIGSCFFKQAYVQINNRNGIRDLLSPVPNVEKLHKKIKRGDSVHAAIYLRENHHFFLVQSDGKVAACFTMINLSEDEAMEVLSYIQGLQSAGEDVPIEMLPEIMAAVIDAPAETLQ